MDGQAHQVLDRICRKAAKALLGCLKASCCVYPARKREVSLEEQGLSGGSGWCGYARKERGLEREQGFCEGGR